MNAENQYSISPFRAFWVNAFEENDQQLRLRAIGLADGKQEEAEDLYQDLIERMLRLCPDPAKINCAIAYLMTTMRRLNVTRWRRGGRLKTESLEDENGRERTGIDPGVEAAAPRLLDNQVLFSNLAQHGGPYTSAEMELLRFYLSGYNCKEIARALRLDVRIVRADLNSLKAKIRYRLKQRCPHLYQNRKTN